MKPVRFYLGTVERIRTAERFDPRLGAIVPVDEPYRREYLVTDGKVLRVGKQEPAQYPVEYAEFQAAVRRGAAPMINDTSEPIREVLKAPKEEKKEEKAAAKKGKEKAE